MIETRIERVPADSQLAQRLGVLKAMRRRGWSVSAVVAPDERSVVLLACRYRIGRRPRATRSGRVAGRAG